MSRAIAHAMLDIVSFHTECGASDVGLRKGATPITVAPLVQLLSARVEEEHAGGVRNACLQLQLRNTQELVHAISIFCFASSSRAMSRAIGHAMLDIVSFHTEYSLHAKGKQRGYKQWAWALEKKADVERNASPVAVRAGPVPVRRFA